MFSESMLDEFEPDNHKGKMRMAQKLNKKRILCSVSPCWTNLKHESQAGMVSAVELVLALVGFETRWLVFHLLDQSSLKYIFKF